MTTLEYKTYEEDNQIITCFKDVIDKNKNKKTPNTHYEAYIIIYEMFYNISHHEHIKQSKN